jgi:hypothetical protein
MVACVGQGKKATTSICAEQSRPQAELVLPREYMLVVLQKPVVVVTRSVRRINEDEVVRACGVDRILEITGFQCSVLEQVRRDCEIVGIEEDGLFCTDGDIELTFQIHAVKTVPAGAIKV